MTGGGSASAALSPAQWRASGESFAWRGHRVFYRAQGAGPPLLLLHGFPTSSWDWRHVWDPLAASHRVIALDYIGFGFSDKPADGPYSVFAYADQADALLARLGVARVHVLAHDLGDTVAQELLARDRERRAPSATGGTSAGTASGTGSGSGTGTGADSGTGSGSGTGTGAGSGTSSGAASGTLSSVCLLNGGLFPELHRPRPIQTLLDSPLGFLVARLSNRRRFAQGLAEVFGPATQPSQAELDGFWECASFAGGLANYHLLIRYMRERRRHRDRWVGPILDTSPGSVPLAFINGHRDPVSGKHVVARLRELRKPAEIYDLPEIGHYPQTEAPADVLGAYASFRRGLATPA
ncbi:MAG TPA: alpha/beta fold hydrolase [Kofleriaceae bacterium]|nr:alpha/beta fold hydrolase [Kofleriaceae bacterium]